MAHRVGASVAVADILGQPIAIKLLEVLAGGLALLDDENRIRYLNEVGASVFGTEPARAVGRPVSDFLGSHRPNDRGLRTAVVSIHGTERIIDYTVSPLGPVGSAPALVTFSDVTASRQMERQFRAFARTASSVAYGRPISNVLDVVAEEARDATGMRACTVILVDIPSRTVEVGTSRADATDLAARMTEAWNLGAPLTMLSAMTKRRTMVVRNSRERLARDDRFAPLRPIQLALSGTSVTAPMIVRGSAIGVLTGTCHEGQDLTDEEIAFFTAMAGQAAVGVDNARLVANLEAKAASEERHRLSRELHDSVSQALFSLTLQARAVELMHERGEPDGREALASGLREIRELTQIALAEMRALIFELRPGALHEEGLLAALQRHAAAVAARSGLAVCVHGPPDRLRLAAQVETELFRIAQEALQNVVKHANASTVEVTVAPELPNRLRLSVIDDGTGFDPAVEHPGHLGMSTMRERAAVLNGVTEVSSAPGRTCVTVVVPDAVLGER